MSVLAPFVELRGATGVASSTSNAEHRGSPLKLYPKDEGFCLVLGTRLLGWGRVWGTALGSGRVAILQGGPGDSLVLQLLSK